MAMFHVLIFLCILTFEFNLPVKIQHGRSYWVPNPILVFATGCLVTGIGIEGKKVPDLLLPESVTHLPKTRVRVLSDSELLFLVQDLPILDLI